MRIAGRLVESGDAVQIEVANGLIDRVEALADLSSATWITPGWFDIQVNGYAGYDVNAPDVTPGAIIALTHALWQRGVTTFCPTIITASEAQICHSLRAIAAACEADSSVAHSIVCVHIEGPS